MRRLRAALYAFPIIIAAACSTEPATSSLDQPTSVASVTTACTADPAQIEALIVQVFANGSLNKSSALGKWANVEKKVDKNATQLRIAQQRVVDLIDFIKKKRAQGQVVATDAVIASLFEQLLCFVGLGTDVETPDNVWIVHPGDPKVTFVTVDGKSGIQFPGNAVTENTVVTATPANSNALITRLDKYPLVYDWSLVPSQTLLSGTEATVGVCPDPAAFNDVPSGELQAVVDRLVLGHQKSATAFEVLQRVPIPAEMVLTCGDLSGIAQSNNIVSRLLAHAADFILPKPLMARRAPLGGVGGNTSEFSPFGPVDPVLRVGGVGGNTSEFSRMNLAAVSAPIAGTVGTQRTTGLPSVYVNTRRGTPIPDVGVAFAAQAPATQTPVGNASICGADTKTDANGYAAMTCLNFGTTVNYAIAYTKLRATFTVPAELAGLDDAGLPVVVFTPSFQTWLVESYGPAALVMTSPPANRTVAAGNPYFTNSSIPVIVEIRSALGEVVPIATNTVDIFVNKHSFSSATVRRRNAVNGIATFSAVLPTPATGYKIVAEAALPGVAGRTESNIFDVVAAVTGIQ